MQPGLVQVPVFVYPTPVTFYFDDQTSHKQVLTLYNPYEFAVRFRVLCTAPNKYSVVDPEGSIRPRCCIDIVIRHNAVSTANCNVIDKFRIQMHNFSTKQLIGKQDVAATLLPGKPTSSAAEPEVFQHLPQRVEYTGAPVQHHFGLSRDTRSNRLQTPNYIVVAAALVCICALLLPTEGDQDTRFPVYLHLTPHLKLIFAYVLDTLVTVHTKWQPATATLALQAERYKDTVETRLHSSAHPEEFVALLYSAFFWMGIMLLFHLLQERKIFYKKRHLLSHSISNLFTAELHIHSSEGMVTMVVLRAT